MQNAVFVVIITILAIPLIFNRHEALLVVPALAALFLLGFAGPFLNLAGHLVLAAIGLAVAMVLLIALGFRARSGGTAFVAGAGFVMLTWLTIGYGIYLAREIGWRGLTQLGRSSESPDGDVGLIWFVFIGITPVSVGAAVVYGLACSWVHSRKSGDYVERV